MSSGLFLGLSAWFSARTNLKNGREQRELQEKLHDQDRRDTQVRSDRDFDLREQQLRLAEIQSLLNEKHVEEAVIRRREERMEDRQWQRQMNKEQRASGSLGRVIAPSTEGWYEHDPFANDNPGIKSLRVMFQRLPGMAYVERAINEAIKKYERVGAGHPIHFLKGIWNENAGPASWVASELHSWDQTIPTLIERIEKSPEGDFFVEIDIFGFPLGDRTFQYAIPLGRIADDPKQIAQFLSLLTLATADMHFFSTYAKMPLLPFVLTELLPPGEPLGLIIEELVTAYQQMMNSLILDKTEIGVYAALQLAESFAALPDKRHAIEQIQYIEAITQNILLKYPELQEKLRGLYELVGKPEEATRLLETTEGWNLMLAIQPNILDTLL